MLNFPRSFPPILQRLSCYLEINIQGHRDICQISVTLVLFVAPYTLLTDAALAYKMFFQLVFDFPKAWKLVELYTTLTDFLY